VFGGVHRWKLSRSAHQPGGFLIQVGASEAVRASRPARIAREKKEADVTHGFND